MTYREAFVSIIKDHPFITAVVLSTAVLGTGVLVASWSLDVERANHKTAAEDVGRRCVLSGKPLNECVAACSAVDGWFDHPCGDAARRTVLGDAGPAKMRPKPSVAVVDAELDGGPKR